MGKGSNASKKATAKERRKNNTANEGKSSIAGRKKADAVAPVCKACSAVFIPPNSKLKGLQAHFNDCSKAASKDMSFDQCFPVATAPPPAKKAKPLYAPDKPLAKKKKKYKRKG